jgi:magnesium transporter
MNHDHAPKENPNTESSADDLPEPNAPEALSPDEAEEESYQLDDAVIHDIVEALDQGKYLAVEEKVLALSPADIATLLEKVDNETTLHLIDLLRGTLPAEAFAYLASDTARIIFKKLNPREIGEVIADLDTDDAINLLEEFEPDYRKEILRHVSRRIRILVEEGLTYPEDSAGRMMHRSFVAVPEFWTVGKALDYMRGLGDDLPEQTYDVFIVDPRHKVVGQVHLVELMRADRRSKIAGIARENFHTVPLEMDQEEVTFLFRKERLISAPVVDEHELLLGVITIDDIIDVVHEEAGEDILRLANVGEETTTRSVLSTVRNRFPWLVLNMFTAMLAASVIGLFEGTLERLVVLVTFMPIVAGMGGNAGTQALTVTVRALAMREISSANVMRRVGREGLIGLCNGVSLALLVGLLAWLWSGNPLIGVTIGVAMIVNLILAGLMGVTIPILLDKINLDPALGSSIFLTMLTDANGYAVFLGVATLILL